MNIEYKKDWPKKKKQGIQIAKSISCLPIVNEDGIIDIGEEKGSNKVKR